MYAITGITGKVGGQLAQALLAKKLPVRAVLRDVRKAAPWQALGCDIALADVNDAVALAAAFKGAEAVFILLPPTFDPSPDFSEARATVAAIRSALDAARPAHVVCLSTIGAQSTRSNLLTQLTLLEQSLRTLTLPVTFLRPAWFMENASWDVAAARAGQIPSFLQPFDKLYPMVGTADVARVAGELLQRPSAGLRVVELEGPVRVTPNDVAAAFAELLGHPVSNQIVPRDTWESLFRSQGMHNPIPRMQMLDGFNEGWIEFEQGSRGSIKGTTTIRSVLKELLEAKP
jgi:NAD(P)H dehydrogenase (quinone)